MNLGGRDLVSFVGAGGKTSLMFALALDLSLAGQRVIATTTTRIYRPEGPVLLEPDPERLLDKMAGRLIPGEHLTVARGEEETPGGVKLVGYDPKTVDALWLRGAAEFVLVEADGAKGRFLKAPRSHEPVIPSQTTVLVGLAGLGGLGQRLDEGPVFALEAFADLTGLERGDLIGPKEVVRLVTAPQGLFKGAPEGAWPVLFLNQADLPGAEEAGLEVVRRLAQEGAGMRTVIGSIRQGWRRVYDLTDRSLAGRDL